MHITQSLKPWVIALAVFFVRLTYKFGNPNGSDFIPRCLWCDVTEMPLHLAMSVRREKKNKNRNKKKTKNKKQNIDKSGTNELPLHGSLNQISTDSDLSVWLPFSSLHHTSHTKCGKTIYSRFRYEWHGPRVQWEHPRPRNTDPRYPNVMFQCTQSSWSFLQ